MKWKMIRRVLNRRTLLIYFIMYLLFLIVAETGDSVIDMFGGFSVSKYAGFNTILIMRWNLCVLPPVAVSLVFMGEELGTFGFYTIIRARSIGGWWHGRCAAVAVTNLVYPLIFTVITSVLGRNTECGIKAYGMFLAAFLSHIMFMSVLSVSLLAVCRTPRIPLLFFGAVEVIMVVMGSLFPQASKYLFPFWGMAKNNGLLTIKQGQYVLITSGILVLFIVLSILIMPRWLKRDKLVANMDSK